MINQRQLISKGLIMAKIECEIDRLLKIIVKQDFVVEKLQYDLNISEKNCVNLARAYAKSIGIIRTKKQLEKYLEDIKKNPLDEIFVESHKKKVRKPKQKRK